jgi:RNA polymerase sigma-70 factor (ECF subfamily)
VTDYYRRKKDIPGSEFLDTYQHPYNFEEDLVRIEELGCLKHSLGCLDNEELEIINLRYFSEMKYGEMGIVLEKSENAIKMKSMRTINKLKELVKRCLEGK